MEFMTAATAPTPDAPIPPALTQGDLSGAVATAKAEWEAAVPGVDLSAVSASIVDLPDLVLGSASGNSIQIDVNAAGHGWGPMSLITVVRHELGHVVGEGHTSGGLMAETLAVGESRPGPAPAPVVDVVEPEPANVESPVIDPVESDALVEPVAADPEVESTPTESTVAESTSSGPDVEPTTSESDPEIESVIDPVEVDPVEVDPVEVDPVVETVESIPTVTTRWTVIAGVATASVADGESLDATIRYDATTNSIELIGADGSVDALSLEGVGSVEIRGGAGNDQLTVGGGTLPVAISFDGGGGIDTVVGPGVDSTWSIEGAGSGGVAGLTFTGAEHLVGADGNRDRFVVGASGSISGVIEGGAGGYDVIEIASNGGSLSSVITGPQSGTITRGADTFTYTGMEPVGVSGVADLTLTAPNNATVTISDNADAGDGKFLVGFNGGGETHEVDATATSLTILLGAGTNTVTIGSLDPAFVGSLTITGAAGDDTVVFVEKTGAGVYTFDGGSGTDTVVGPDHNNVWTLTGADAGDLGGELAFTGVEHLVGGAGIDRFEFAVGGSVSGSIDGGAAADATVVGDAIDLSLLASAATVDLQAMSVSIGGTTIVTFQNIDLVVGTAASGDTIVGPDAETTFLLTGVDSGVASEIIAFQNIENIVGGVNADAFGIAAGGSLSGVLAGGAGTDTVFGPDQNNTWSITGPNAGALVGFVAFTSIERIVGGMADDLFQVLAAGSIALVNGGPSDIADPSTDTLDLSSRIGPITVDLQAAVAPGVAAFVGIDVVVGTASVADVLVGPTAQLDQTTWSVTGVNSGAVDGVAFRGFENLTGQNATSDAFVYSGTGSISGTIAGGTGAGVIDGFAVVQSTGLLAYQPTTADQGDTVVVAGTHVTFTGMDAFDPIGGDATDRVVTGTIFDRSFTVEDAATAGSLLVTFEGIQFTTDGSSSASTFTFARPTRSLTVSSGSGADTAAVDNLDPNFEGALFTYSNGVATVRLTANDDVLTVSLADTADDGAPIVRFALLTLLRIFGSSGSGVQSVDIYALDGNDLITIEDRIAAPIAVFAGGGDDTLAGPDEALVYTVTGEGSGAADTFLRFDERRGPSRWRRRRHLPVGRRVAPRDGVGDWNRRWPR